MFFHTFSGTHYDIGRQIGLTHRLWLVRTLATFVNHHRGEISENEKTTYLDVWESMLQERTPKLLEQLRGICAGAEVSRPDLLAMNFRIWDLLQKRRGQGRGSHAVSETQCTNIAFCDTEFGVLLGGSLEDIQIPWHLACFCPMGSLKHMCITWVGTAWAARGINECGLAFGVSSMDVNQMDYPLQRCFADFALKQIMEHAHHVTEAVEIFMALGPYKGISVVFADTQGCCKLVEATWAGEVVHEPRNGALFCVNHVQSPELQRKMETMGYCHQPGNWSQNRYDLLQNKLAQSSFDRNWPNLEKLLMNHDGFPDSQCHPNTAFATIAAPVYAPYSLWVADGPPCCVPFTTVSIPAAGKGE